jgi:hypothetical protein
MPDPSSARIFISYSRKDGAKFAATLRTRLEREKLSVWQDLIALEGGRDWWSQIEDALKSKALQHFVLIVTPAALASPVVRREIRLARQEGKTVSPIKGPGLGELGKLPRWLGQIYDLDLAEHRTRGPSSNGTELLGKGSQTPQAPVNGGFVHAEGFGDLGCCLALFGKARNQGHLLGAKLWGTAKFNAARHCRLAACTCPFPNEHRSLGFLEDVVLPCEQLVAKIFPLVGIQEGFVVRRPIRVRVVSAHPLRLLIHIQNSAAT